MSAPDPRALAWSVRTLCPGGRVGEVRDLHEGLGPWLVRCASARGAAPCSGILRVAGTRGKGAEYVRIEAAALRAAEASGVVAPRLLGLHAGGGDAGRVASLQSVLEGGQIVHGAYRPDLLRSLGGAMARVHRVVPDRSPDLPARRRALEPGEGFLEERRRFAGSPRWSAGERLLQGARAVLRHRSPPPGPVGLVHGDAWLGNAMAAGLRCTGLFDWGCAGIGHPGVDVGYTRLSAALTYGLQAADDVLAGWEAESGAPLPSVAYWDVVAALTTPPDLGECTDLRDEFLLRALRSTPGWAGRSGSRSPGPT
ncbi:MAG: phosphotransferase family protein [Candidatus Dormibacteraceae bacterium]